MPFAEPERLEPQRAASTQPAVELLDFVPRGPGRLRPGCEEEDPDGGVLFTGRPAACKFAKNRKEKAVLYEAVGAKQSPTQCALYSLQFRLGLIAF